MSIAQECSVPNCNGAGKPSTTGKRYFHKGLCNKHYLRQSRGQELDMVSTRDARHAIIVDGYAKIPIGKNAKHGYAIVDIDNCWLDKYKWTHGGHGYARSEIGNISVRMHHLIIGTPTGGLVIDHINRNRMDNRRSNLRIITPTQNTMNSGVSSNSSTGYKGVYKESRKNRPPFKSQILSNGKFTYIGSFHNAEDAARAYDTKAKELNGEFAYLNFP